MLQIGWLVMLADQGRGQLTVVDLDMFVFASLLEGFIVDSQHFVFYCVSG